MQRAARTSPVESALIAAGWGKLPWHFRETAKCHMHPGLANELRGHVAILEREIAEMEQR